MDDSPLVLFFGCGPGLGHHLYESDQRWASNDAERPCPWKLKHPIDDLKLDPTGDRNRAWCIDAQQLEGRATLSHACDWTRLGWADRSLDSRRGSHANILASSIISFEEMLELGKKRFPRFLSRMGYPIVLSRDIGNLI